MSRHKRTPRPPGQRSAGFVPAADYAAARARAITPQPPALAAWARAQRETPRCARCAGALDEDGAHVSSGLFVCPARDRVVTGVSGEVTAVEDAREGLPERRKRKARERHWCSQCLRYWKRPEIKADEHVHDEPGPRSELLHPQSPRPAPRPAPRKQAAAWQGLAGRMPLGHDDKAKGGPDVVEEVP